MPTSKIVFCTDFSENSAPARELCLEYAQAFGAELVIVHVINSWAGFPAYSEGLPIDMRDIVKGMEEAAKANLESLAMECSRVVKNVKTCIRVGVPAQEIVNLADEEAADLIVMGTHGWTGIKHLVLGSTAENVVRTANCPVLTVRAPAKK